MSREATPEMRAGEWAERVFGGRGQVHVRRRDNTLVILHVRSDTGGERTLTLVQLMELAGAMGTPCIDLRTGNERPGPYSEVTPDLDFSEWLEIVIREVPQ